MKDPDPKQPPPDNDTPQPGKKPRKSISMHEDVPVWADCCSCEAEPYWAEQADEPDPSSD